MGESRLESLQSVPIADAAPDGIDQDVLQAALNIAWEYSKNGVEGHRAGHILAVGPATTILCKGYVKWRGIHGWSGGPPSLVITKDGEDELLVNMNKDGAHIIDGADGRIVAGRFFCQQISCASTGGSGASAAQEMSTVNGSVVLKISSDRGIKEFREGRHFKTHCRSRVAPGSRV